MSNAYLKWGACVALGLFIVSCNRNTATVDYGGTVGDWPVYGGTDQGLRYSPLTQVNRSNVAHLHVVWTYHIGEKLLGGKNGGHPYASLETTPIIADGRMYLCSSTSRVAALDPESGKEIWTFNPKTDPKGSPLVNCRGVTYYRDNQAAPGSPCAGRILAGTADGRLFALDAGTGKLCRDFGAAGIVDLLADLGPTRPGDFGVSSPPVVVADRIVVGSRVIDNNRLDVPAGVVRAYDVRTGALSWAWNPLPPGQSDVALAPVGQHYARGTTNAWAPLSVDRERGLVFVPTGNTSPDYYGGLRHGLDYYSSSVVALEAATGHVVWHFQTVHHDIWDYDVPSQPVLFDFPTSAGSIPAVAQSTKQGYIFILDRQTGRPLVPVEEIPAPQGGAAPGETLAATQPVPSNPAYVMYPRNLTKDDMWGFTPWDKAKCRAQFEALRFDGAFTPPSIEGSVEWPSAMGVMNWGGVSIDPTRGILIVNTSRVATVTRLVPRVDADARIARGEPLSPAYGTPYAYQVHFLLSPFGAPCNKPPWGTLTAIDLKAGKRLWEVPLGTTRYSAPFPLWFNLGVPNIGGAVVTASGLVFVAATLDSSFRAFDVETGEKLWQTQLPAGGQATPMTYRLRPNSKQYVVIAAGGSQLMHSQLGDSIVAYALGN
jgi:quinoprotein glucose dehydrogenase